jgi:hypothetical protein
MPVYWRARRLVSGEEFQCAIESESLKDPEFLTHLNLSPDVVDNAVSTETFRERWKDFLRPHDLVTVYHPSTARLLRNLDPDLGVSLVLKSVRVDPQWRSSVRPPHLADQSRASYRLDTATSLVNYLNALYDDTST